MEKSKSGDSKAFSDLSAVIRDISYSYFLSKHRAKKIINIDDVDDLTNNVYLAFAEQFQVIENAENWLRRVLFLTFVRWYKRSKSRISYELSDRIPASEEITKESDFIDAGTALEVLDTLSAEKQEIVKLRFWADLKFSEIAEKLNKNEAAVKKMFYRTLLEIKENLE
ncbi:MAG TPA: RNA polymerase sigma factor [Ignavibacteriaceae bacterium]